MVCENCGKEMIKVGVLTEQEQQDMFFVNEKLNCAWQAINPDVVNKMNFTDGQVFEYFRAGYDQLAQANYLRFMFERSVKKRLNVTKDIRLDEFTFEVFIHPNESESESE